MNKKELKAKIKRHKDNFSLTLLVAIVVLCFMLIALLIGYGVVAVLINFDVIAITKDGITDVGQAGLILIVISLIIAFALTVISDKTRFNPINKITSHLNSLASGDFSVRLSIKQPLGAHPSVKSYVDSFNTLAEELGNTEMLRSDFVNNFSHEIKTPIVSIAGFAKLLKKGNLTEEQKLEYIEIIEEESMRLSAMATNVLNLTKIENQSILTSVSDVNISEQIRNSFLLLEDKWTKKEIELELNFDEYTIMANEELLKQVWINLIDNAIKFSPVNNTVSVKIWDTSYTVVVEISNIGETISEQERSRIFNKFYQTDKSHSSEGNGIGLALVKKIAELHKGGVFVQSQKGTNTFTVVLPKKQRHVN